MKRARQGGMALLDMLVSLAVMALIGLSLAALFGLVARSGSALTLRATQGQWLADRLTLRRWIEEAPSGARLWGTDGAMWLETVLDTPFNPAAMARIRIALDEDGTVEAEAEQAATRQNLTLGGGGMTVTIDYYGSPIPGAPAAWHGVWPPSAALPDLVRIRYADRSRTYPPLTVRPALEALDAEVVLAPPPVLE